MTISTTGNQITYAGDGASLAFAFPYPFITTADLKIYLNGVIQSTGFSVSGTAPLGGIGTFVSGTVTFSVAPAAAMVILIYCDPDLLQSTSLPQNDPFPSKTVEKMIDKITLLVQRIYSKFGNSITFPPGETTNGVLPAASVRAGFLLGFDSITGALQFVTAASGSALALAVQLVSSIGASLIGWIQAGTGAVLRTVQSKLRENVSVKDFGALGDGTTNDLAAINTAMAAAAAGNLALYWPDGTYRVTDTINVSTKQRWWTNNAVIKLDRASTFIKPLLYITPGADSSAFEGFDFDQNASGIVQPSLGNQVAFAYLCAVLVGADDVTFSECRALNSWDNGFAVGSIAISGAGTGGSPYTATQTVGSPQRVILSDCRAENCGIGNHNAFGELGFKGGGFNVLTGSRIQIDGCSVTDSYNGFIADFGGQAQAIFSNCFANNILLDGANPANGSGIGYYISDGPNTMTGCSAYFCQKQGYVITNTSGSLTGTDLTAYACANEGFLIAAGNANLTNLTIDSCGTAASNTYNAILIDSTTGAIGGLSMFNVRTRGALHKYAVYCQGVNTIAASVIFGRSNGLTGLFFYNEALSHFLSVQGSNLNRWGFGNADPGFEVEVTGSTASYLASVVGDSGGNGTFVVDDVTNRNKRIAFGYDSVNDLGVIQCINAGVAKKPLLLNPSGGDVGLGLGSWNTGAIRLGSNYLWVDSSTRLRIKSSAPTSDTDGTVVGTQT